MIGFVIGNGLGRANFDLFKLKDKGLIVGCNALYRDPNPASYIVAIDNAMLAELKGKCKQKIVTQLGTTTEQITVHSPKFRNKTRSSGGLATDFAISQGASKIYWIGFDNPKDTHFKKASIYGNTPNYLRQGRWGYKSFIEEYRSIISYHKEVSFVNVVRPGVSNYMEEELGSFSNYSIMTYDEFDKALVAQWI